METRLALDGLHQLTAARPPVVRGSLLTLGAELSAQTELVVLLEHGAHVPVEAAVLHASEELQ
jgi:hypothetical protein